MRAAGDEAMSGSASQQIFRFQNISITRLVATMWFIVGKEDEAESPITRQPNDNRNSNQNCYRGNNRGRNKGGDGFEVEWTLCHTIPRVQLPLTNRIKTRTNLAQCSFFDNKNILSGDNVDREHLKVNGVSLDLMVDSGATICAIKQKVLTKFASNLEVHDEKLDITGIGGTLTTESYVFLELYSNGVYLIQKN